MTTTNSTGRDSRAPVWADIRALQQDTDVLTAPELSRIRQSVLQAIAGMMPDMAPERSAFERAWEDVWNWRPAKAWQYAAIVLLGVSLAGGSVLAVGNAVPGTLLYPIKIAGEKVRLALTPSVKSKTNLQVQFAHERLNEIQQLGKATAVPQARQQQAEPAAAVTVAGQAKVTAAAQVTQAITSLQQEQTQLQSSGDTQAAAAVGQSIAGLQSDAQAQAIPLVIPAGTIKGDDGGSDDQVSGTSSGGSGAGSAGEKSGGQEDSVKNSAPAASSSTKSTATGSEHRHTGTSQTTKTVKGDD